MKDVEQLIQNSIQSLEGKPSERVWDEVNKKIASQKRLSVFRITGMAAAVGVLVIAAFTLFSQNRLEESPLVDQTQFSSFYDAYSGYMTSGELAKQNEALRSTLLREKS